IHIDIDPSEMGKNVRPHLEVVADAKTALGAMLPRVREPSAEARRPWLTQIDRWREEHPLKYVQSNGHLQPQDVMIEMYRRCAGEGGFVMTAQELSVAVKHKLDIKIVLLNNFSLGMVRQFQDDFYGGVRSEIDLSDMPDFVKLADAYGLPGMVVESADQIQEAFDFAEGTS